MDMKSTAQLEELLKDAQNKDIISAEQLDQLKNLSLEKQQKSYQLFSFSKILAGLGAFAFVLGIILVISSNWQAIPDIAKLLGLFFLVVMSHIFGYKLRQENHENTGMALHFLGSGLIIAIIGLIAQIFHLESSNGGAFLLWFMMIAPLAWLLKSKSISVLAFIALQFFLHVYINSLEDVSYIVLLGLLPSFALYFMSLSQHLENQNKFKSLLKTSPLFVLMPCTYMLGFLHRSPIPPFAEVWHAIYALPFGLCLLAVLLLVLFQIKTKDLRLCNQKQLFNYAILTTFVCLFLFISYPFMSSVPNIKIDRWNFGYMQSVDVIMLLGAIVAWIAYFMLSTFMVYYGVEKQRRSFITLGVTAIGIGIFTRFLDLVGKLFDTGVLFIMAGTFLLIMANLLEKWRKKMIAEMPKEVTSHDL